MTRASLGPYQIVRRLGRGGMAEVFLAVAHGASGFERKVALKTLVPELQGEPALERALVHEARLAGRLAHRNLVAVLGLGVDDGVTYVVMEWIDGGDLDTLARGRRLPLPLVLLVAEELALGLAYLHRVTDDRGLPLGLVHRDVSPSNVLVSRAGEVKLADFGIAKATALADLTGGTRKGKYAYMSPEQLAGEPLTGASDQFALGVTLVELATGARPFDGETPLATMENVRRGLRPELSTLPAGVAALALRALSAAPADRFASSEELRLAIAAARRDQPPVALPDLAAWVADDQRSS
ncbi:MAG: serine/threonine protein kinase [Deltaproteobacteria bacterium]|nr:serine/threonine protein kinase [Kofleriaceae bacterium]